MAKISTLITPKATRKNWRKGWKMTVQMPSAFWDLHSLSMKRLTSDGREGGSQQTLSSDNETKSEK